MTYYEYWYNDSRLAAKTWRSPKDMRDEILTQQLSNYNKASEKIGAASSADSLALEDFLELRRQNSAYWAQEIENMLWGEKITSGSKIGSGNFSYQNMAMAATDISAGKIAGAQLGALTRQLTRDLEEITQTTNKFWDMLVKRLQIAEPAVAKAVLDRAARGLPADPQILNEIFSRTGRQSEIDVSGLSKSQASLAKQYANLYELVALLPTLGSVKKVPDLGRGTSKGKLIAMALGKIGGNFSSLSSKVANLAGAQAALQGERKFAKEYKAAIKGKHATETINAGWMTIQKTQYDNIVIPENFTAEVNVGDGRLIVTEKGVVLSAGGTIPEKEPTAINVSGKPINIWENFSLNVALNEIKMKDKYYMYELAAVNTELLETGLGEGHAGGDTGALEREWHSFVEYAALAYFLKKVMKQKLKLQADTYYVLGSRVYTPASLLEKIQTNPEAIEITGIPERATFSSAANYAWMGTRKHYRRQAALRRSQKIPNIMNALFSGTILGARLNAMAF